MRYGLMFPPGARVRTSIRIGQPGALAVLSAALLATALIAGCSWQNPTTAAPPSLPPAPGAPQVITNLSQLSSSDTDAAALANAAKVLKADPDQGRKLAAPETAVGEDRPSTLRRLFLEDPSSPRFAATGIPHTEERLLNAKAAEHPGFSSQMLAQLISEMIKEEKLPPLVTLELSEQIRPVILTAILDERGQLKELVYQQHSGFATIDNFVIAACKASLWANNMPAGAMYKDGTYRLRIEAQLSKYSTDREGNRTFLTQVGLGIL
jgi:hypothetical protein